MVVLIAPWREFKDQVVASDVTVDLTVLRHWSHPDGYAQAALELDRVFAELRDRGVEVRSARRLVAALARYAFLVSGKCPAAWHTLWRMHAVDAVPAEILAALTWEQVRPRLRELVVPAAEGTHYVDLTHATCELLLAMRAERIPVQGPAWVFRREDGNPWDAALLRDVLARMAVN